MSEKLKTKFHISIKEKLSAGFVLICLMMILGIIFLIQRGYENMELSWAFNIGMDLFGMAVSVIIYYSCMQFSENTQDSTASFTLPLFINGFGLFLDECCWLVQGIAELKTWNLIANVFFYLNNYTKAVMFWQYAYLALNTDETVVRKTKIVMKWTCFAAFLMTLSNFFAPVFFSVTEDGNYQREAFYPLSVVFLLIFLPCFLAIMIHSKASAKEKIVISSFILMPVSSEIISVLHFGISTQQAISLLSIVLIYCVLVTESEKKMRITTSELEMAARVQAAMLPHNFPPFPDRKEFDIYASMEAAREVGGDFYDFFLIDEDHLCLIIADVSGKGVPASLYMTISKTILQSCAMLGKSAAEILEKTNQALSSNNPLHMFVTVWVGILEISTGRLTAANAGHEYPFLKQDTNFVMFKDKHGFVIGGSSRSRYREYEIQLTPGTKLFVYTDGVPEATNEKEEMFGTERLLQALNSNPQASPEEILHQVRTSVSQFVMEAEQFDDLTMLCLEYHGTAQ